MMRRIYASKLIFALFGAFVFAGCSEQVSSSILDETEEPAYRRAKDMLTRNLNSEALSNFNNVILKRAGNAPESHLEAGLIYMNHMNDPASAYYHFNQCKAIKGRDPASNSRDAGLDRVEELINTSMKELLSTLDAKHYRLKLLDTITQLQKENETLKTQLAEARKGAIQSPPSRSASVNQSTPGARVQPQRPAAAPRTAGQRRYYVVKERDSLYKISREVYGDPSRWQEILDANRGTLPDASQLQPGMSLVIP